ncbi:hypothetical protein XENTR_v10015611 [Xenopus tropicalis]|uniref:Uncharacterized XB5722040 n=1 Tax=Xenopus tropicalis TaxID=8364 RepID=A0A803K2R4_XENTR|nr:uncharacterized protein LOC100496808 isoform X1 [Xenopus tropicalis]XP_031760158.1 uncharacterized protein LOC100496808 isoform X1 [Xenopus tropicalis]XP_031760159.1 uncharacterized protein LOC100496808 isoform X1 [Xenopus tropicalis]XP_031760160.1 uncharacterized protein LOC100496808 isoform X1 [Xenopus tropicalis]KAE8595197.1 hypothetical protein XENTR_v10015611 [Xenopus tropicalis]
MEPVLSQIRSSLQVKLEGEEWDSRNHLTSIKREVDFVPINGFPEKKPEKLQIKLEKEELKPIENSAVPLTDGFSKPQIKEENENPEYYQSPIESWTEPLTEGDFMVTESEITQVIIKEEELDPDYYQTPSDTPAVSLYGGGAGSDIGIGGRPSSESDKLKDLLERLRKRPAVTATSGCFPFNPQRQRMNRAESPGSQESSDEDNDVDDDDEDDDEEEDENTNSPESSSIDGDTEETAERVENVDWCNCGNCVPIDTQTENLCCTAVEKIRDLIPCGAHCITAHSTFLSQVVDYARVDTGFKIINYKMKRLPKHRVYMRCLRKTAFRSFMVWLYGYLGAEGHKPIPACAIRRIRKAFPDPNHKYTGFPGALDYLAEKMALD